MLWKALDNSSNILREGPDWLRQLAPGLQLLIFTEHGELQPGDVRSFLKKIERRADIDTLACLTILLKINLARGEYEHVWHLTASTFRVLLMLGNQFRKRGLADAIFRIYVERIFSLAKWNGLRYFVEEYEFSFWAELLHQTATIAIADNVRQPSWLEKVQRMNRILDGRMGLDMKFTLDPLVGPDGDLGPLTETAYSTFEKSRNIKKQAMAKIYPENNFDV